MADLQALDAGLFDVRASRRRHDLVAVLAQAQRLVEVGAVARPHEAAVALQGRRHRRAPRRARGGARRHAREPLRDRLQLGGQAERPPRRPPADARRSPPRRGRRGWRRGRAAAAGEREARQRAGDVGRGAQAARRSSRNTVSIAQEADGVEPRLDGGAVAHRACEPRGQLARAGRRHRAVDGGEQAALLAARARAQQLEARRGSPRR